MQLTSLWLPANWKGSRAPKITINKFKLDSSGAFFAIVGAAKSLGPAGTPDWYTGASIFYRRPQPCHLAAPPGRQAGICQQRYG